MSSYLLTDRHGNVFSKGTCLAFTVWNSNEIVVGRFVSNVSASYRSCFTGPESKPGRRVAKIENCSLT